MQITTRVRGDKIYLSVEYRGEQAHYIIPLPFSEYGGICLQGEPCKIAQMPPAIPDEFRTFFDSIAERWLSKRGEVGKTIADHELHYQFHKHTGHTLTIPAIKYELAEWANSKGYELSDCSRHGRWIKTIGGTRYQGFRLYDSKS